jgi:low temperature requirement protein LtrA
LQTAILLGAVWWVWIDTAWATNWLDVDRAPVRILLFGMMGAGLLMAVALPRAFEDRGSMFGLALAAVQLSRTGFVLWAVRGDPVLRGNFQRIILWHGAAVALWVLGGFLEGDARLIAWLAALGVDSLAPMVGFRVPGLGVSRTEDWTVEGGHMAERCALFTIIALGESVLVIGATAAGLPWSPPLLVAFASAFLGALAMWWIYFSASAEAAAHVIAASRNPGAIARLAYTYIHILPIAGIIVVAVGDEWTLAHPTGHADLKTILAVIGGPALYLAGVLLFKLAVFRRLSPSRTTGLVLLAGLAAVSGLLAPMHLSVGATAILVLVGAWESIALARGAESA